MHPYEMGVDPQAAAQGGQHQAALWLALHRDRAAAAARPHRGPGNRARGPAARAHRLRDHRCRAATSCTTGWAICIGEPVKEYPQFEAALCLLPVLPPDEALALLAPAAWRRASKQNAAVAATRADRRRSRGRNFRRCFSVEAEYRLALIKAEQAFVAELVRRIERRLGSARAVARLPPTARRHGEALSRIRRRTDELRIGSPDDAGTSPGPRTQDRRAERAGLGTQSNLPADSARTVRRATRRESVCLNGGLHDCPARRRIHARCDARSRSMSSSSAAASAASTLAQGLEEGRRQRRGL